MKKAETSVSFGPDETMSNRLGKVFEATNRDWNADKLDNDEFLGR